MKKKIIIGLMITIFSILILVTSCNKEENTKYYRCHKTFFRGGGGYFKLVDTTIRFNVNFYKNSCIISDSLINGDFIVKSNIKNEILSGFYQIPSIRNGLTITGGFFYNRDSLYYHKYMSYSTGSWDDSYCECNLEQ